LLRKIVILTAAALAAVVTGCAPENGASANVEKPAIEALLHATFDRPDETLVLEPIVTSGDFAVVGWVQGERGGRALLKKEKVRGWRVFVCAGDHLKAAAGMMQSSVPDVDAAKMAADLAQAEARLPKESLAKMASFGQPIIMAEELAEHPPVHTDGH